MKIIEYAISEEARSFRVDRRSVAEWKRNKTKISVLSETSNGLKIKRMQGGGGKPLSDQLEEEVLELCAISKS